MQPEIEIALLTGGFDKPYAFGIAMALVAQDIHMDVIGSDEVDSPEMHATPNLNFLNIWGSQNPEDGFVKRAWRVLTLYVRLVRYTFTAKPKIFHILWNNKIPAFDRTVLMLFYKIMGKKIVFTAHNINAAKRDGSDSFLNRLTLKIQYRLADHIFVHTEQMKAELHKEFGVSETAITVIPFGINNSVPDTDLTAAEAKRRVGVKAGEKTILFFGNIGPYKGVDYLVSAFLQIVQRNSDYRLIIAGKPRGGAQQYLDDLRKMMNAEVTAGRILLKVEYIPDEDTELYFKAADVFVLPYTNVSQSGVLFLGYNFGLPVVASDVGSFREDVVEGENGFFCKPCDAVDLASKIEMYFQSNLFKKLETKRLEIRDYAIQRHSWDVVSEKTRTVYAGLLKEARS